MFQCHGSRRRQGSQPAGRSVETLSAQPLGHCHRGRVRVGVALDYERVGATGLLDWPCEVLAKPGHNGRGKSRSARLDQCHRVAHGLNLKRRVEARRELLVLTRDELDPFKTL